MNDEQNNNFIGGNASDFDDSPYHNLNFNCNYHDEDGAVEKLTKNKGNLLCLSLNIQSLPSKFVEFSDLLNYFSAKGLFFDVIALQELWSLHDPDMFQIEGYNFIYKSQKTGVQGGGGSGFILEKI